MALEYVSVDQGNTYHICDPGSPGYCGTPIIVDTSTTIYTEADIKRDHLELPLCEACAWAYKIGGVIEEKPEEDDTPELLRTPPALVQQPPIPSPALAVANAKATLETARTDFERLAVREQARAAREAAKILGLREVQVSAAEVVAMAERAIAKANPAQDKTANLRRGNSESPDVTGDNVGDLGVSTGNLRQIRQAHDKLTDEQFEAAAEKAREKGEPLTRTVLKREAKKLNPPDGTEPDTPDEPKPPTKAERLEAEGDALKIEVEQLRFDLAQRDEELAFHHGNMSEQEHERHQAYTVLQRRNVTLESRVNELTGQLGDERHSRQYWERWAKDHGWTKDEVKGKERPEPPEFPVYVGTDGREHAEF